MEVQNRFGYKITLSLQKKINDLKERRTTKSWIINLYISKGGYLVVDKEMKTDRGLRYFRYIYGSRGGWQETRYYKDYDFELKEPIGLYGKDIL